MNGPNAAGTRYYNDQGQTAVLISAGGGNWSTSQGTYWDDWREELAFDPGLVTHILALQEVEQELGYGIRHLNWDSPEYAEIKRRQNEVATATKEYVQNRWPYKRDAPSGTRCLCPIEHLEVYWVTPGRSFTICDGEGSSESLLYHLVQMAHPEP